MVCLAQNIIQFVIIIVIVSVSVTVSVIVTNIPECDRVCLCIVFVKKLMNFRQAWFHHIRGINGFHSAIRYVATATITANANSNLEISLFKKRGRLPYE